MTNENNDKQMLLTVGANVWKRWENAAVGFNQLHTFT